MNPDELINSLLIREIVNVTRDGIVIERVRVGEYLSMIVEAMEREAETLKEAKLAYLELFL